MCSIFGAVGEIDYRILSTIQDAAKDRGRDGGGVQSYILRDGTWAVLGNWRATPTTEVEDGRSQPYDGIVHNGTVANDRELGNPAGAVDSEVLARVIDRSSAVAVANSLEKIVGSYALAIAASNTVFLAANYKPLYYLSLGRAIYFSSMARHFDGVLPFGVSPVKLPPYSVLDLLSGDSAPIRREKIKRALVIASGGLDSTVAAAAVQADGYEIDLLHFWYGCRAEASESGAVDAIAESLGCRAIFMRLGYAAMAGASPLLSGHGISSGMAGAEYAHEWVPARNFVMVALATAYAEANGYGAIVLGNNLEESGAYPDNEEEFTHLLGVAMSNAVQEGKQVEILTPVGALMKHEIVALGVSLGAPLDRTWSCYRQGERHCGECGPCFMRKTAFERNGFVDPVSKGAK